MTPLARRLTLACLLLVLGGCAATGARNDPLEGVNRAVFSFNEAIDSAVLEPVATGYQAVVPQLVRTGIENVFANIGDLWSAVNQLLQAKPVAAVEMGFRFTVNTTFGLGGLIDIATDMGLQRRSEDFGQTLGRWGLGSGPYLVLPLLGPSDFRDAAALTLDLSVTLTPLLSETRDRNPLILLQLISTRARLLSATRAIDAIALDKYVLIRDGFLARRRNLVYDGDPPEEPETDTEDEPAK